MAFHIMQKYFVQQHSFLCSNIQHSTFHHLLRRWSPFLSRTGNVLQAFLLQSFCILAFLKENIPLPDSNLNSHLSNLYFSLVTRLLNSQACFSPFIISTILFKRSLVTGWVLWRRWERVMLSVAPLLKTSRAR